jgi:hypothetical protein
MKLEQYRTLWGVLDLTGGEAARSPVHTFDEAIAELANEGYDGVELPLKLVLHIGMDHVKVCIFLVNILYYTVLNAGPWQGPVGQTPHEVHHSGPSSFTVRSPSPWNLQMH